MPKDKFGINCINKKNYLRICWCKIVSQNYINENYLDFYFSLLMFGFDLIFVPIYR